MAWMVKRILEGDYGCEERTEEERKKVIVILENEEGLIRQLTADDDWLYAMGIDEGSVWPDGRAEDSDGRCTADGSGADGAVRSQMTKNARTTRLAFLTSRAGRVLRGIEKMDERLKRQLDFALEIDKEKNIFRQTHLSGHGRNENDAEHAWHMVVMAYLLREYANEEVDITKVMLMCLIHDIVEIDAGDTYAYDEENLRTQKAREDAAKERIFSILPDDQKEELTALFDEFEAYETPEAKFAHSLDNLQPLMLNNSNGGSDWVEHGVTASTIYGRQRKTRLGSQKLYEVTDQIIRDHVRRGTIRE